MKTMFWIFKAALLLCVVTGIYAFSNYRYQSRELLGATISFTDHKNHLITDETVNKLLIQSYEKLSGVDKEILVLNKVENSLKSHPMLKNVQLFMTTDRRLGAIITQREPIARVTDGSQYYIDSEGLKMPLSEVSAVRVPLVHHADRISGESLFELLDYINRDEFLRSLITDLSIEADQNAILRVRGYDFKINLGQIKNLDRKFNNFKAFYKNGLRNNDLKELSYIRLEFLNQVVSQKY